MLGYISAAFGEAFAPGAFHLFRTHPLGHRASSDFQGVVVILQTAVEKIYPKCKSVKFKSQMTIRPPAQLCIRSRADTDVDLSVAAEYPKGA